MKLRYVGLDHHRIIEPQDLTKHGLSEASIDVWQGDLTGDLPQDVADWLLSEHSTEASSWEEVSSKEAKEEEKAKKEAEKAAALLADQSPNP